MGFKTESKKNLTTIIFPCRLQPPHIAHILTISKLAKRYEQIIIHVANDVKEPVIKISEILNILKTIFHNRPHIRIITGKLFYNCSKEELECLPPFDLVVSAGNMRLLKHMWKNGFKICNVPRSTVAGLDYSASMLRKLYGLKGGH